jgi:hypothetical protein
MVYSRMAKVELLANRKQVIEVLALYRISDFACEESNVDGDGLDQGRRMLLRFLRPAEITREETTTPWKKTGRRIREVGGRGTGGGGRGTGGGGRETGPIRDLGQGFRVVLGGGDGSILVVRNSRVYRCN